MTALIQCENVCMSYGRQEVLHHICLDIERGIFLPFVGPNGAGKTTLLRIIAGLLRPTAGTVTTPFKQKPPGFMPQQKAIDPLYPVSTRQIIEMGLYPLIGWLGRISAANAARVDALLERFGLAGHERKTFSELSGGMKQKALLCRALVADPTVLIMDEPAAELDEASEEELMNYLCELCVHDGVTVLLAHHGMGELPEGVETVCLVRRGRAVMAPRNEAVALARGEDVRWKQ